MHPEKSILELILFENWLRFYYLDESSGRLVIPGEALTSLKKIQVALAEDLNGKRVELSASRDALLAQFRQVVPDDVSLQQVLGSAEFIREMDTFQSWLQLHAAELAAKNLNFVNWLALYERWKTIYNSGQQAS